MAALAFEGEHGRRLGVLGSVLDIIDADRFIWPSPRDEGAVRLFHDYRCPTIVVTGLPDDEVTMFRVRHA